MLIFQSNPQNNLDVNGNMSIGYNSNNAPESSLIIDGYLSFGTTAINYPLTIMDTALVGEITTETTGYSGFFQINGDGTYPLYVGSEPTDFSELLFVNGDMSLKEGFLSIRTGASDSLFIDRDETSNNEDIIQQISNTSSLIKFAGNDQLIVRVFDGTVWNDQVIIDDNLFGIGGYPTTAYPLMIEDSATSKVKFQAVGNDKALFK